MNDPIAGCDTDSLVKKDGKWQFRDERTKAEDECGPTEEELAEFWAENEDVAYGDMLYEQWLEDEAIAASHGN